MSGITFAGMGWNSAELDKYLPAGQNAHKALALQSEKAFEAVMMNVARQFLGHEPTEADAGRMSRIRRFDVYDREHITGDGVLLGEVIWGAEYDEQKQATFWRVRFVPAA